MILKNIDNTKKILYNVNEGSEYETINNSNR